MREFNKIFGIGISRTGTSSLVVALNKLGISTIHWPLDMESICAHRASADITVACRFQQLDQMFPGSLFIYTERSAESWVKSVEAHYQRVVDDPVLKDGEKLFAMEADIRIYGFKHPLECDFVEAYRRQHRAVLKHFVNRREDLLRLNISAGQGWERLCSFLDLPILDIPFPHSNRA